MKRLTYKDENGIYQLDDNYVSEKGIDINGLDDITDYIGEIEDLMEKYEINSVEALEEIIKDYDDMAKSIVEMGLGVKVEIKDKSE